MNVYITKGLSYVPDIVYQIFCLAIFAQIEPVAAVIHPIWLFVVCMGISAVITIGTLLINDKKKISVRIVISHVITMGSWGGILSMLLFYFIGGFDSKSYYLIAALVGVFSYGGMKLIGVVSEKSIEIVVALSDFALKVGKETIITAAKNLVQKRDEDGDERK